MPSPGWRSGSMPMVGQQLADKEIKVTDHRIANGSGQWLDVARDRLEISFLQPGVLRIEWYSRKSLMLDQRYDRADEQGRGSCHSGHRGAGQCAGSLLVAREWGPPVTCPSDAVTQVCDASRHRSEAAPRLGPARCLRKSQS